MPDLLSNLASLFISPAFAQAAAPAIGQPTATSSLMQFVPLFLIFGVFYFLLIRPQQKKYDAHQAVIKALSKGDKVITGGGIHGTIVRFDEAEETATVEIAQGVQIKVVRSTISGLAEAPKPANEDKKA